MVLAGFAILLTLWFPCDTTRRLDPVVLWLAVRSALALLEPAEVLELKSPARLAQSVE